MASRQPIPPKTGINLFGYDVKIETFEEAKSDLDGRAELEASLCIRISYNNKKTLRAFVDEFTISHKSRTFLLEVVYTIYACFSEKAIENGFIQHDVEIGSFEFKFDSEASSKSRILSVIRTCCLSKAKYSKNEAIKKVKEANAKIISQWGDNSKNKLSVNCINGHVIHDPQWELEVTLNLSPGLYHFHVPDLLDLATTIRVRDYVGIRDYYKDKLAEFYQRFKIFRVYLDYISGENNKLIWIAQGFEAGPMENLYSILKQIKNDDDSVWSDLFELCLIDIYETDNSMFVNADFITEQSVANFIALSIKYYCLDRKDATALTDCDKYLLSIVLPYFDIVGHDKMINTISIPLISGLFNRFVNKIKYINNWKMNIDAETLKNELLLHLHPVVKNRWQCKQLSPDRLEYNLSAMQPHDDTMEENLNDVSILLCYDNSYEFNWTMWTNKGLKRLYQTSKGYWKILNEFDEHPRIPIAHLEAMRCLLSKKKSLPLTVKIYDRGNVTEIETAQYIVNKCKINGPQTSTTTLSIRIVKAADPFIDKKKKIKSRDSYFLHYKPNGDPNGKGAVEWAWYNNDRAKYEDYNLGENVTKQIEATYQGVQEYNFAISSYNRGANTDDGEDERLFIDAQLTELSLGMTAHLRLPYKPFVLRFTFGTAQEPDATHVINMEQVAINAADGSQFPRNIRRLEIKSDCVDHSIHIDDEVDHRIYCLGKMLINIDSNRICLNWIFCKDEIDFAFKSSIDMERQSRNQYTDSVKNALELWRSNNLFDQNKTSITVRHTTHLNIQVVKGKSVSNYNDVIQKPSNYNHYKLPSNYDEIVSQNHLKCVDERMWKELDALDEDNTLEAKSDDAIRNIYNKQHKKDLFKERLFRLISLQRVQSIISVIKQEPINTNTLIVALSNCQLLFDSPQNKQTTTFTTSLSYLFDGKGSLIKRIDSKNTIYDINIHSFDDEIVKSGYLHDFLALSSQIYKSTLFVFRRPNSANVYISFNGFIRKLSLSVYDEDLYYFLPQFITLQIGDRIDIECFCYRDSGTVIDVKRNNYIYYVIRSSQNVFYTLNYYEITNRPTPSEYISQYRSALLSPSSVSLGIPSRIDPSDTSHPMHILSLSLLESSKQAISAIDNMNNIDIISRKLVECGVMYLLHHRVENVAQSKEISDLLSQQKGESSSLYIDEDVLRSFREGESLNEGSLDDLAQDLQDRKLISCKKVINMDFNYNNLNKLHLNILNNENMRNNKLYMISIIERRELIVVLDSDSVSDDVSDIVADEDTDSDSDNWAVYEEDNDGDLQEDNIGTRQHIAISSVFTCIIKYSYEMSVVYPQTRRVEDLMAQYRNNKRINNDNNGIIKWSVDENRLLTFFSNNLVYNEHDLNDRNIVDKLKIKLNEFISLPRFFKLYKKFEEFIKRIKDDNNGNNEDDDNNNDNILSGVSMTRNAVLLQKLYIPSSFSGRTMVVTYNPLQSVIITYCSSKDITHPIHIYRSAYSSDNISFSLSKLYNKWMLKPVFPESVDKLYKQRQIEEPKANIIDTLSLLIRYNKKYEIVIIPSSICLNCDFLNKNCKAIAPDIDAISKHRVTFIYCGILYDLTKKENVVDDSDSDDDRFFLDDLKFLIAKIRVNIIEDCADCMDPPPTYITQKRRLRSLIKRNNGDIMLRWLKIGCGSCFLHEASGRQTEIGPPPSGDYDHDFPDLLKKAMFIYYIDCKIPYKLSNKIACNLCGEYMIKPSTIINCKSKHTFCKLCIKLWYEMLNNPDWGILKENHQQNKVKVTQNENVLNEIILPKYCPIYNECFARLENESDIQEIKDESDINIPITIYQQLQNENNSRYKRLDLLNRYQQLREMQLINDQSELTIDQLRQKYKGDKKINIDAILQGY